MQIIGVGVGRTGTYSLKMAIDQLGFGPCHHMEAVLQNQPTQLPLWTAALDGRPDWNAIYGGYGSAVDWPTAGFCRELAATYPSARFILTVRSEWKIFPSSRGRSGNSSLRTARNWRRKSLSLEKPE